MANSKKRSGRKRLSPYNIHVRAVLKAGGTMKSAAKSWKGGSSKKRRSGSKKRSHSKKRRSGSKKSSHSKKRRSGSKKRSGGKRKLSAYNIHMKKAIKGGMSFKAAAHAWKH